MGQDTVKASIIARISSGNISLSRELIDSYSDIMKKLYIQKGTKTSFQYHKDKVETNFLIEGSVEAWFEDKKGHIDVKTLSSGSIWTIPSGVKHRIVTLEDIILIESSTPEVDDVIRIEDDALRGDGRIQSEHDLGNS